LRALMILLLAAAPAVADENNDKEQARLLLSQGNALFERGEVRAALANFRAAYALYPSPRLLVNAAAAERELGELAAAANDLSAFLDEPDDDAGLIERARSELRVLTPRLGRVALGNGWPPGTTLELDGRVVPSGTYVRVGEHRLRARTPSGHQEVRRGVVSAGAEMRLNAPPTVKALGPLVPPIVERPHKSRAGWVVLGLGLTAAVGVGLGLGLYYGLPHGTPVSGDLGVLKFSDFK
jgi:hypothetical protein